ncbi:putative DNA polymerase alpha catalytic subunit [Neospora caninum Liverpool]|uniref:DNA polymerase n=1 Tax=Neospora caninum (strain Liverpool) TaxID=572307 RepID=F0VQ42_NEOCL|nr:putative DNA polymerase alpha catalytic subunit [Neospora caninum Liverpool]CBZ55839.1 putative DNA polymerase alpha catalytic subunit [Neospora caninum Liverpool]CEL70581.1 TPA: DNA polymerase alpha catalytic subunit, putative [Neospora caninum Liverpool]|eukprot:XP_003885865.1 putative DNA polymerase alpha catalytic subunit [Neospora caninum Liverpool]
MSGSKQTALSALEKIRRQRRGEAKASEQYEVKDENAEIYATVTEEDYQRLKQTRRAQEWIDGEGYSDDGEEWWASNSEDDEDEEAPEGRRGKRRNEGDRDTTKPKKARNNALAAAAAVAAASAEAQGMRSLVQHFSAISAETHAKQEQNLVTKRYVESLQSVDKLFGEEEDSGESATTGETSPLPGEGSRAAQEGRGATPSLRDQMAVTLKPGEREQNRRSTEALSAEGHGWIGASRSNGACGYSPGASSFLAQFGVGRAPERAFANVADSGYLLASPEGLPGPGGSNKALRLSPSSAQDLQSSPPHGQGPVASTGSPGADVGEEDGKEGEHAEDAGEADASPEGEKDEGNEDEGDQDTQDTLFKATGEYEGNGPVLPKQGLTLFMQDEVDRDAKETEETERGERNAVPAGDQASDSQPPICEDGTLPFYFLDAWEEAGTLYLFGKVWPAAAKPEKEGAEASPSLQKYRGGPPPQSCCVVVRDMMVPLFFRTREQVDMTSSSRLLEGEEEKDGAKASEERERELRRRLERRMEITKAFFKQDLPRLKQKYRWRKVAIKGVFRHYAFDAPDVPRGREQTFVKVFVPASAPPLSPDDLEGETYSHVFGVGQSLIELLLVKRRIKGPCWLRIGNFTRPASAFDHLSWCQHEVYIQSHKDVRLWNAFNKATQSRHPDGALPPPPPLTVVALSAKSVQVPTGAAGHQDTDRQLAMASFFVYRDADIDDQNAQPRLSPQNVFCGIRRVRTAGGATARVNAEGLPLQFYELCTKQGFSVFDAEKTLLLNFINRLAAADPDILVGHNIYGSDLEILGQRCAVHGLPVWHRLSRLKRPKHVRPRASPSVSSGASGRREGLDGSFGAAGVWGGRLLTVGRLVCDTYMQAHELLGHRVNYDLVPLLQDLFLTSPGSPAATASSAWAAKIQKDIRALKPFPQPLELLEFFQRREAQPLLVCLQMCVQETFMTVALCWRLNCLPLTRELTTIGGNLWARSLQNQRAERNAFLLLHEFHREKFICPDREDPYSRGAPNKRPQAGRTAPRRWPGAPGGSGKEDDLGDEEGGIDAGLVERRDEDDGLHEGRREGEERGSGRAKANYAGGLVLEPRVGLYDTFVLLLDFNSLYPSIIQEYNVCFSTVKRPVRSRHGQTSAACGPDGEHADTLQERDEDTSRPHAAEEDVQGIASTPGLLPRILRQLVQRRRAVKASMKGETNPVKRAAQEIKQLALKLTANSIYGCLGFSRSRFYAKELAAFITQQGRNILTATKDKVERTLRLEVVYGDTDSIMINTGLRDDGGQGKAYAAAVRLGEQVKAEINKSYKKLEIDLEAVFRRLLLLKKKKYVCCIVLDYAKRQYKLEQKGLDIVRRDWSKLTKVVGNQLLQIMFRVGQNAPLPANAEASSPAKEKESASKDAVDSVVEELHEKLREVAKQLRAGRVPLEFFVITKALTKPPQMYARGTGGAVLHPHVQVSLRMQAQGLSVKPGNEIPYVICSEASVRAFLASQDAAGDEAETAKRNEQGSPIEEPGKRAEASKNAQGRSGPLSPAERAFHPREVAGNKTLEMDVDYYLEQQLLPPIQRMCAFVEGTSASRLAECLGLDGSKHARPDGVPGPGKDASRDAREKAGEERIMALISKSEEKYKMYKLPINLPCVACKATILGKDVLQFMRCPSCTWWISPSTLRNFVRLTLAALQSKFARPRLRCSSCHERFDQCPPPSSFATGRRSRLVCPRCEEGNLREELSAHDLYMYLDEMQFYLAGDVTAQQVALSEREKDRNPEKAASIMRFRRAGNAGDRNAGAVGNSGKDSWPVPVGVDPNLVTKVLEEGRGKPPTLRERLEARDCLEAAYKRVREAEVPPVKRGVELRFPHAVAAYIYLEKIKHGATWIDMQQEREKLQQMVAATLAQNAYRMIELRGIMCVMQAAVPVDPIKQRWHVLRGLNRVKACEQERKSWGDGLRQRGSSVFSQLESSFGVDYVEEDERIFGQQKLHTNLSRRFSDIAVKREGIAE